MAASRKGGVRQKRAGAKGSAGTSMRGATEIDPVTTQIIRGFMETVAFEPIVIDPVEVELGPRETKVFEYELAMKTPGFVLMRCEFTAEGGREVAKQKRVGCEPTEVLSELTREEDFDEFWAASLEELAAVSPEFELIEVSTDRAGSVKLYEVVMRSHGGVRVRGWLRG